MIKKKPICVGTGLVALDVVINGNPQIPLKLFAGGSCGNVLTILSFLNWETFPIARLRQNIAFNKLKNDLKSWNVNTLLLSNAKDGSTPIIIHRIKKDKNGNPIHSFQFRNPENNEWLPFYKPVLSKDVPDIIEIAPIPSVFYFDRVNRSSVELAKYFKNNGALVFFEPSSINDIKLFEECLEQSDILKYSNERIKDYSVLYPKQKVALEIETLGRDGLRYRFNHSLKEKKWTAVPSYRISYVVDAAGAGDWFSAGVISKIGNDGRKEFRNFNKGEILEAIKFGQGLGSLNCFFDGARGLMYSLDKKKIDSLVKKIQLNILPSTLVNNQINTKRVKNFSISSLYK